MKKSKLLIIATSLFLGFASTSYAVNPYSNYGTTYNQSAEKNSTLDSTEVALNHSESLLVSSWVNRKLNSSDNQTDKARFAKAKKTYQEAIKAFHAGNDVQAKRLALESIRIIASSVSKYNVRVAQANQ